MDIDDIFVKNRNSDDDHRKYCSSKISGKTSKNVLYELLQHFFADTHIYKHTYNIYIYTYACNDNNMIKIVIMMTKNAHDNKHTVVYSDSDNDDIIDVNHVGIPIYIYIHI